MRGGRRWKAAGVSAIIGALALGPADARGCPVCRDESGRRVRAGIASGFAPTLAAVALPFPIFAAVIALIARPPLPRHRPEETP